MKGGRLLVIAVFFVARAAFGQNADCRQSWMAPDAPAFCDWQTEPLLPEARTYQAVTLSGNQIYVLGGYRYEASTRQVTYYDSVVRSTISTDGRLSAWTAEPSFKNPRSGAATVAAGKCLFVSGGSTSTATSLTYYDDIHYARIQSDGLI